jgi:hypothetical protein
VIVGNREIQALMLVDRPRAVEWIKEHFIACHASVRAAASSLKVDRETLQRWIEELGLVAWCEAATEIAKEQGWFHTQIFARRKKLREERDARNTKRRNARRRARYAEQKQAPTSSEKSSESSE